MIVFKDYYGSITPMLSGGWGGAADSNKKSKSDNPFDRAQSNVFALKHLVEFYSDKPENLPFIRYIIVLTNKNWSIDWTSSNVHRSTLERDSVVRLEGVEVAVRKIANPKYPLGVADAEQVLSALHPRSFPPELFRHETWRNIKQRAPSATTYGSGYGYGSGVGLSLWSKTKIVASIFLGLWLLTVIFSSTVRA